MFYISDIYDDVLKEHFIDAEFTHAINRCYTSNRCLSCNLDSISTVLVGVYDVSDNSIEYYFLPDLLGIMYNSSIEVKGVECKYFKKYIDKGYARIDDIVTMMKLKLHVSISGTTKEDVKVLAKAKVMGVDIDTDGALNTMCDNFLVGDSIVIPEYVKSFSREMYRNSPRYNSVTKLVLHEDFNLNTGLAGLVWFLKQNLSKDALLVIDGDFKLSTNTFNYLRCNIYVTNEVKIGNFKAYVNMIKTNRYIEMSKAVFTVEDSKVKYIIDLVNFEFYKEKK